MELDQLKGMASCMPEHLQGLNKLAYKALAGAFVECGVFKGGTAAVLVKVAKDERPVYLFDSFEGFPDHDPVDTFPKPLTLKKGTCAISIDAVKKFLLGLKLNLDNVHFVKGFFKDTIPNEKKNVGPIALLHFDGDFYHSAITVFTHLFDQVVDGGYIVIHDYPVFPGLQKAIHKFIDPKKLIPLTMAKPDSTINNERFGSVYFKK